MRLLVDTHVLIWAMEDNPKLGRKTRAVLADRENEVLFSAVSIWEVLMKIRARKLLLDWRKLGAAAAEAGFRRIGLEPAHLEVLADLPDHHRDPFDHLLFAQAIAEDAHFVTADAHAGSYPLKVIGCQ